MKTANEFERDIVTELAIEIIEILAEADIYGLKGNVLRIVSNCLFDLGVNKDDPLDCMKN